MPNDASFLVIDYGLFTPLAERLARDGNRVGYFSWWKSGFPKSKDVLIGRGLDGVERVDDLFDALDEYDVKVFPDIYDGDLQERLVAEGHLVWGSRKGDWLERDREALKDYMAQVGLPIAETIVFVGLDVPHNIPGFSEPMSLRDYLQQVDDVWLKTSSFRGDFETFFHDDYAKTLNWFDDLASRLGPSQNIVTVFVEQNIEGVEVGYDSFHISGQWPTNVSYGIEEKSGGYLGQTVIYDDLPDVLKEVNLALEPALRQADYRNLFSSEVRISGEDQTPYLTDPCCRGPSPPSELLWELFDGWSDTILAGAQGQMQDLIPTAKFGACLSLYSEWGADHWMTMSFPAELAPFVKLRNYTRFDGQYHIVPSGEGAIAKVGSAIGMGDTLDEAIQQAIDVAHEVKGYSLTTAEDALDKALKEVDKAREVGAWK